MSEKPFPLLKTNTAFFGLWGIAFGSLIIFSSYAAIFILLGLISTLFVSKSPLRALSILILLMPFTETNFLKDAFITLPGVKPLNILAVFVVIISLSNHESAKNVPAYAIWFAILFMLLFGISILRSLPHLDVINALREEELPMLRYILSDFIKPLIYFLPVVISALFVKSEIDVNLVITAIVLSLCFISLYLLYLCMFVVPDLRNVDEASEYYLLNFGMHRNDLANFFIIGFPIVIGRFFIKKSVLNISILLLTIIATGFLFSRTAYLLLILSFALYLIFSKRAKFLPIFVAVLFGLSLIISTVIVERATKGLQSRDSDEISAGRISSIWLPLIDECFENPTKLLFGKGRYAILSSNAAARGTILETIDHPHNMYLELVLDVGFFGLIVVSGFFAVLLRKCYHAMRTSSKLITTEYYHVITVSIISYFFAGMTGRSLFPVLSNSYLWVIAGLAIALNRISDNAEQEHQNGNQI